MGDQRRNGAAPILGTGVFFASNGLLFAGLLPWYPQLVEKLQLSSWEFGLVVAAFAVGAVVSSVLPARLIARFGPIPVILGGTVLLATSVAAAAWSPNAWMLAICIFWVGAFDAIVDVAQNVVGVDVQDESGRTILSSMHALWSLGGLVSGAASTAAATAGMDMRLYLLLAGIVGLVLVLVGALLVGKRGSSPRRGGGRDSSGRRASSGDSGSSEDSGSSGARGETAPRRVRWRGVVVAALPLAVIAVCGTMVEDVANSWSAIAAAQLGGVPVASAGIAFGVVIGSQCLGRFSGDLLVQRFGLTTIVRVGGCLIALGGLVVVTAQEPVQLLFGFGAMGYGSATLVPGALGAAAHIPGTSRAAGVTLVNWIMRIGYLGTSPIVGLVATMANLRWGLSIVVVIGVVTVVFAGHLSGPGGKRSREGGI